MRRTSGWRCKVTRRRCNRLIGFSFLTLREYHDETPAGFSYHRSPDVLFHYDVPAGAVDQGDGSRALARNTKGEVTFVEDTSGEEHTSFDARGRVEWTVKRIPDPMLQNSRSRRWVRP